MIISVVAIKTGSIIEPKLFNKNGLMLLLKNYPISVLYIKIAKLSAYYLLWNNLATIILSNTNVDSLPNPNIKRLVNIIA